MREVRVWDKVEDGNYCGEENNKRSLPWPRHVSKNELS